MQIYKHSFYYKFFSYIVLFFFTFEILLAGFPAQALQKAPWPDDGNLSKSISIFSSPPFKYFGSIDKDLFEFLKYGLIVRNTAIRELLSVRIELLEHLKALNPYYYAILDSSIISKLEEEFPPDKFEDTSLLITKAKNITAKKDESYIKKFTKNSISTSIELVQIDEKIKYLKQVKRSDVRYENTTYKKKPCLLNEWTNGWYEGTYSVAEVKGGYESYNDLPEMKKVDVEIADLVRQRKYVFDSMHIIGTPFFNKDGNFIVNLLTSDRKEPTSMLYESIFWELFQDKFSDYKSYYNMPIKPRLDYPPYSQYESIIKGISESSLLDRNGDIEDKYALKTRVWLATGINEAIKHNTEALEHILKREVPTSLDDYSINSFIEHISFLSQFAGITDFVVSQYKRISPYGSEFQVKKWNKDLGLKYKAVERRYEISMYALLGMGTIATIFLWGSGVVLYAAVGTISLMGVGLAYQNYSRVSGELTFVKSLFYDLREKPNLKLRQDDYEKYMVMEEEAFRDLVVAGVAVGINALFFLRMAYAARVAGKSIAISKESLKNCFLSKNDKPTVYFARIRQFVTKKPANAWKIQQIMHSLTKGNSVKWGRVLTVGSFLYFIVDFYSSGKSSDFEFNPAFGGESQKYVDKDSNKIEMVEKINRVVQMLKEWDKKNSSNIFWQFGEITNIEDGYIGVHDMPYTVKNGNYFFINYKIVKFGTPENILFEIASMTYLSIISDVNMAQTTEERLLELQKLTQSGKVEEAREFAISVGGEEY